jgi:hypothetical protein
MAARLPPASLLAHGERRHILSAFNFYRFMDELEILFCDKQKVPGARRHPALHVTTP